MSSWLTFLCKWRHPMRRRHWAGWALIVGLSVPFLAGAGEEKVRSPEAQRIVSTAHEGARDRFASFGIDNARIEQWGEFPVGFNRGPWFGRVVDPEPRSLEFVTM